MAISIIKEEEEYILRMLPLLLKRNTKFRREVSVILSEVLATKDELNKILEEIHLSREETNRRFEEMREETNRRFEETNRRFEEMRAETNRRFEETNRRFEEMNRQFEKSREETNRRFEEMREETNQQFAKVREEIKDSAHQVTKELGEKISGLGSRWGIMAENTLRAGLESVLSEVGFKVEKWRRKDENREVFLCARDVEIDMFIKNGKTIALEMKSSLTFGEVENFERAVRFYEKVEGKAVDERIIVAIYPYPGVKEYTQELGIKLVSNPEEIV